MVGIGIGGGSRRSGEEEAGGIGRRQHNALVAASLLTGGVCWGGNLLELIAGMRGEFTRVDCLRHSPQCNDASSLRYWLAPIRRAFPTRYDRWRRASGRKCDTSMTNPSFSLSHDASSLR